MVGLFFSRRVANSANRRGENGILKRRNPVPQHLRRHSRFRSGGPPWRRLFVHSATVRCQNAVADDPHHGLYESLHEPATRSNRSRAEAVLEVAVRPDREAEQHLLTMSQRNLQQVVIVGV